MSREINVAVVGLGIAGAAVASRLARDGHRVTVFEQAPRVGPVGAGILLQPSGQGVLAKWGLLDELASRCEPIDALHAVHASGRTLVHVPYRWAAAGCRGLGVHRADLFELLHRECIDAGVDVRLDAAVTACERDGDHIAVRDRYENLHGPFDFLLACDGSKSRLRGVHGRVRIDHEYRHGALWTVGRNDLVQGELRQTVRGTRQLVGLLPTGGGRCSFFASLHRDRRAAVFDAGFDRWRSSILDLCPLAEPILGPLGGFDDFVFTTYRCVWMAGGDERVLFLGDAAHATSPHLGQGVNLALLDADTFADCLRETGDYPRARRLFVRRRRTQIRFYALLTATLTPFFQSDGFVKSWLRNVALPVLPHVPMLGRQMALVMAGVKTDWLRSAEPFEIRRGSAVLSRSR